MSARPIGTFDEPLTACPMCTSPRIRRFDHDYHGRVIFRCRACGVKFMNPQYTDSYLAEYYARYICVDRENHAARTARRSVGKGDAIRLVSRHVAPGRLLSIGCGDGLELELARRDGWRAEGYDVDPETTREVARRTGMLIYTGDFFRLGLPADSYDCVFLDQVLEHPKNPGDYLREIRRILRPAGVLFIGCPNVMSLASAGKTLLGKLGLRRRRGRHYSTDHHQFFYSPRVLRNVLERYYGFRVVVVEGDPLSSVKPSAQGAGPLAWGLTYLRQKWPVLESTFRLVARKDDTAEPRRIPRSAAA